MIIVRVKKSVAWGQCAGVEGGRRALGVGHCDRGGGREMGPGAGKFNWNIYKFNSTILMGRAAAPLNSKGVRVHGVVRGGGGSSIEMKNTYNRWGNER